MAHAVDRSTDRDARGRGLRQVVEDLVLPVVAVSTRGALADGLASVDHVARVADSTFSVLLGLARSGQVAGGNDGGAVERVGLRDEAEVAFTGVTLVALRVHVGLREVARATAVGRGVAGEQPLVVRLVLHRFAVALIRPEWVGRVRRGSRRGLRRETSGQGLVRGETVRAAELGARIVVLVGGTGDVALAADRRDRVLYRRYRG
jgi:hypothetical protein